jgi:hypothetical protein
VTQSSHELPPVGAILSGPHWPDRVRVVRVEPRGTSRVLIEAVTLDGQARLFSRLLTREDLAGLQVEAESDRPTLDSDLAGFRLAVEATRIRLAYTYDPQGELLTEHTEHLLLLTATPHKGDPENFRLLLGLLDPDLFADMHVLAGAVGHERACGWQVEDVSAEARGYDLMSRIALSPSKGGPDGGYATSRSRDAPAPARWSCRPTSGSRLSSWDRTIGCRSSPTP